MTSCLWQWPPGNFPGPWNVCVTSDSKNRRTNQWHEILHSKRHVPFTQPSLCFVLSQPLWLAGRKKGLLEHMHLVPIVQTGNDSSSNDLPTSSCCHQPLLTGRSITEQNRGQKACGGSLCCSVHTCHMPLKHSLPRGFLMKHMDFVSTQAQF